MTLSFTETFKKDVCESLGEKIQWVESLLCNPDYLGLNIFTPHTSIIVLGWKMEAGESSGSSWPS